MRGVRSASLLDERRHGLQGRRGSEARGARCMGLEERGGLERGRTCARGGEVHEPRRSERRLGSGEARRCQGGDARGKQKRSRS
eukprot:9485086-Pyramimonas_sp.AAC.1